MKEWFLPTVKNNHRARFLGTPALVFITVFLILTNSFALPVQVSAASNNINVENLLIKHNEERVRYGLSPLLISESLNTSAQRKALAMLESDCWSHYCPDGKSPWEFFDGAGYEYLLAGENLAEGFFSVDNVITAWLNSPTHRENMLRGDYEEVGFGIVQGNFQGKQGNIIIVVHFGTPSPDPVLNFISPIVGELPTPTIVRPASGTFFGSQELTISGTAPEASEIQLNLNDQAWAKVSAEEGVFTYNASLSNGKYYLTAQGKVGTRQSGLSNPVEFTVDIIPNIITPADITLTENVDGQIKINIVSVDLQTLRLKVGSQQIDFIETEKYIWTARIGLQVFENNEEFEISSMDKAGNKWSGNLSTTPIIAAAYQLNIDSTLGESNGQGRVSSVDIKAQINLAALFLFASLFGIDFLTLKRTGLTKVRSKTQLHIGLLLVILIIIFAGSLSGQILEGIVSA